MESSCFFSVRVILFPSGVPGIHNFNQEIEFKLSLAGRGICFCWRVNIERNFKVKNRQATTICDHSSVKEVNRTLIASLLKNNETV